MSEIQWRQEVERIVTIASRHDHEITQLMAEAIWEHYSKRYAAGWLGLPEDDDVWNIIRLYLEAK
jgi:hypothetical protein